MSNHGNRSDVLICMPCYNSQDSIEQVLAPLLEHSDADILLVDDSSDVPVIDLVEDHFSDEMHRITVVRPSEKVYSGGAKNIGIKRGLAAGYRITIALDSDIITPVGFVQRLQQFFVENPQAVIVAPSILPYGRWCRYADTLINFSNYIPDRRQSVSRKNCLAGYAFALNMEIFRRKPCFHVPRYGGEDVLFFRKIKREFGLEYLPMLNHLAVLHKPPRSTLAQVLLAQKRYGRAFFTHNDGPREYLFNKLPALHLLTPRCCLMILRLLQRRRYRDLLYFPLCWCLDFARAVQIVRLKFAGYCDPGKFA